MESRSRRLTEADHHTVIVDRLHLRMEAVHVNMYLELYGIFYIYVILLLEKQYKEGLQRGLAQPQASQDGEPEDVNVHVSDSQLTKRRNLQH